MTLSDFADQNELVKVVDAVKSKAFAAISNAFPSLDTESALVPTLLLTQLTIQFGLWSLPQTEKDVYAALVKDIIKDTLKILSCDIRREQCTVDGSAKFLEMLHSTRSPGKLDRDQVTFILATAGIPALQANSRIGQFFDLLDSQLATFNKDLVAYLADPGGANLFWPAGTLFSAENNTHAAPAKRRRGKNVEADTAAHA